MARKVFISVLGFTNYGQCYYVKDGYKSSSVRFIQEATLDYLCQQSEWTANDTAYILLTNGAEKANWYDDGHRDRDTGEIIKCEGLCSRLQKMNLPFAVDTIKNLPDGNTEEEIWNIFERVFSELQDNDELYFDLTHGFRYLPMLVMVLINYSKFLKNTSVKSITYGNYESRNKETNEAPIIDLLPLSALQDWTYAAGQFLDSGNINKLRILCNNEIKPILRQTAGQDKEASKLRIFLDSLHKVIEDMQTCRGLNIIKSTNLIPLKESFKQLNSTCIKPLNPIFKKIKEDFDLFENEENVKNGFISARWCVNNGLFQQAITILQENIVTLICKDEGFEEYVTESHRNAVNKAFKICFDKTPEEKWLFSSKMTKDDIEKEKCMIFKLLNNELLQKLSKSFSVCTGLRNDINHSGMRSNPMSSETLKRKIIERIDKVENILNNQE